MLLCDWLDYSALVVSETARVPLTATCHSYCAWRSNPAPQGLIHPPFDPYSRVVAPLTTPAPINLVFFFDEPPDCPLRHSHRFAYRTYNIQRTLYPSRKFK